MFAIESLSFIALRSNPVGCFNLLGIKGRPSNIVQDDGRLDDLLITPLMLHQDQGITMADPAVDHIASRSQVWRCYLKKMLDKLGPIRVFYLIRQ